MAIEIINVGASPNDGNGDPIRDAFIKCNDNFDELDTTKIGGSGTDNFVPKFNGTDSIENSLIFDDGSFVGVNTTSPTTNLEVNGPDYSFSAGRQASNRKVSIGLNDNGQPSIQSFDSSNAPVNLTINPSGGNVGIGTLNPLGLLHLYKSGVTTRMVIDGDAGQSKIITYRTGGLQRFGMYLNNTAETGSNAGSDFQIRSYNDAGSLLSTPFFIKRSTGNIGIGTTSPGAKLQTNVAPSGFQDDGIRVTDGTRIIQTMIVGNLYNYRDVGPNETMLYSTGNPLNIVSDGQPIKFTAGTNERMRIDTSGNVGIGTTTPLITATGRGNLTINGSNDAVLVLGNAGSYSGYLYADSTRVELSSQTQPIAFATNGGERMRITSSGDVGIGTTSPVDKLEVNGGIRSTGLNGFIRINDGVLSASRADGMYIMQEANAPMIMWTNNSERMRITSGGNVGIGTSSPTEKLQVSGSILCDRLYTQEVDSITSSLSLKTQGMTFMSLNNYGGMGNVLFNPYIALDLSQTLTPMTLPYMSMFEMFMYMSSVEGMIVYNTDNQQIWAYTAGNWNPI